MIFAAGKLLPPEALPELLDGLEKRVERTLAGPPLEAETVISALDGLGRALESGELDPLLLQYAPPGTRAELEEVRWMLRRETLEARLGLELGALRPGARLPRPFGEVRAEPPGGAVSRGGGQSARPAPVQRRRGPLDRKSQLDKITPRGPGLSLAALKLLTDREPRLAPWLYALEASSRDTRTLERLAALADGVVTWGGDGAVAALRRLAPPGSKLIEWGHRLSFAYLADWTDREGELTALARHIVRTGGLLCSSCQVIFLDMEDPAEGARFCETFLPLLERAAQARSRDQAAQAALHTHTYRLERLAEGGGGKAWFGTGCSLTWKEDRELELSPLRGNVLVKCLPRGSCCPF